MTVRASKREDGKFRARVFIGVDENGVRKYKSFTAAKKKDAEKAAEDWIYEQEQLKAKEARGITVEAAVQEYIDSKANILSPSTIKGYTVALTQYMPPLYDVHVGEIDQLQVQQWINQLAADHSPKTCRNAHGLLSATLAIYRPQLILRTRLPRMRKKPIYVPDSAEIISIGKAIKGQRMELPFILAAQCGLRASEVCALERRHVHKDCIIIEQALVDGIDGAVLKDPKSDAGNRKVPISAALRERLLSVDTDKDGRLCPYRPSDISSAWCKFRSAQKLPEALNFHALRHHFASQCLLLGMPQKYIAEMMGHEDVDMIERVYQHTFPSAQEEFAHKIRANGTVFFDAIEGANCDRAVTETA